MIAAPADVHARQRLIQQHGRYWDQDAVSRSVVLIVGAGNIGDPLANALARAGVGRVDIVDFDVVSAPNLSRGVTYVEGDIGRPKAEVLAAHIRAASPGVQSRAIVGDVRFDLGVGALRSYDAVLLATDNFDSRLHVNRVVHRYPGRTRAVINGAIADLAFSVETIVPGATPCFACGIHVSASHAEERVSCNGVASAIVSTPAATNGADGMAAAACMAKEALLVMAGLQPVLAGREFRFDGHGASAAIYETSYNSACGDHVRLPSAATVEVPFGPGTGVDELRQEVGRALHVPAADVALASPFLIIDDVACRCGARIPVRRPQRAALEVTCPTCGAQDPEAFAPTFVDLLTESAQHRTLGEYGVPVDGVLAAHVLGRTYAVLNPLEEVSR